MKKWKLILIGAAALLGFGIVLLFGLKQFVRSIYRQQSCEWANIDNLEMHAKVDIPAITHSACSYDAVSAIKMAYFELDKAGLDLEHYVHVNLLSERDTLSADVIDKFYELSENTLIRSDLFYKFTSQNGENSHVLLSASECKLWVTVEFAPSK